MKVTAKQFANILIDQMQSTPDMKNVADAFIGLLSERHELKRVDDVIRAIDLVWKERFGAATITIETASTLNASTHTALSKIAVGAELREVINKTLIAGARLRIDDRIIDGSILGKLNQLKIHLQSF